MSGIWNRTLVYLGLREEPEETFDDLPARFVPEDDPHAEHAQARPAMAGARVGAGVGASIGEDDAGSAGEDRRHRSNTLLQAELGELGNGERNGSRAERGRAGRSERADRTQRADRADRTERAEAAPDNVLSLRSGDTHVRAVPTTASRAAVVEVHVFDDVEAVGARYRTGQPVLMDASSTDVATARRIIDFVSGLTYGLRGEMTKVGLRSFLVVPAGVALPAEERRRLGELGYRLPTGSDT